jgi:hypothetical protein
MAYNFSFEFLTYNCSLICHKISIIPKYPAARFNASQNAEGCEVWALGRRNNGKSVVFS